PDWNLTMRLTVYLAGEIHTAWRDDLMERTQKKGLDLEFVSPQLVHDRSDNIGEDIQGTQPNAYFRDLAASDINNFRTEVLRKSTSIIRAEAVIHPLKEASRKSSGTVSTVDQADDVLASVYE